MVKGDFITLALEQQCVRGGKFAPAGREGINRSDSGEWPIEEVLLEGDEVVEPGEPEVQPLTVALQAAEDELAERECVLALPLSKVLVRIQKMPLEVRDDLQEVMELQMDKLSPFPGEELAVGYEVLSESESDLWVCAAALPAQVFEEIGGSVEGAKLHVVRSDLSALGWLRSLYGPLKLMRSGRRVLLLNLGDGWDLLVVDGGTPVLARGLGFLSDSGDLVRELTLSLLNVELEAGPGAVVEAIVVSSEAPSDEIVDRLGELLGVEVQHVVPPDVAGGVEGVARRTVEGATLDLTPQSWRDVARESRTRKRVVIGVGIAAAIWAVLVATLYMGPFVYQKLTARTRRALALHAAAHKRVSDTRERVNLIMAYTDRTRSALELLRLTSANLPMGVELLGFTYRRDDGVRISGEADSPTLVYELKNLLDREDEIFESVTLIGVSASRSRHKFDIDAKFREAVQR